MDAPDRPENGTVLGVDLGVENIAVTSTGAFWTADERGIAVEQATPQYTSQRCSSCGFTARGNRPARASFCCQKCGYENHADYNAAKNIGLKLLRHNRTGGDGGAPVGVRSNINPVPEPVRAGVHGERPRL